MILVTIVMGNTILAEVAYTMPKTAVSISLKDGGKVKGYLLCSTDDGVVVWMHKSAYNSQRLAQSAQFISYGEIKHFSHPRGLTLKPLVIGSLTGLGVGALLVASADGEEGAFFAFLIAGSLLAVGTGIGTVVSFIGTITPRHHSPADFKSNREAMNRLVLFNDVIPVELQTFITQQRSLSQPAAADTLQP